MTYTKRYVADFKDILGLRLTCPRKGCGTVITIPPKPSNRYPQNCPECQEGLWPIEDNDINELNSFLKALRYFVERNGKTICNVQLELEPPEKC